MTIIFLLRYELSSNLNRLTIKADGNIVDSIALFEGFLADKTH